MNLTTADRRWLYDVTQAAGKDIAGKTRLGPFVYRAYDNSGRSWRTAQSFDTEAEAREALKIHAEMIATTPTKGVHQKIYARQANGSYNLIEHVVVKKLVEEVPDLSYYKSAYEQADATLRLILTANSAHKEHEECGLICKINAVEGLLETAAGRFNET